MSNLYRKDEWSHNIMLKYNIANHFLGEVALKITFLRD